MIRTTRYKNSQLESWTILNCKKCGKFMKRYRRDLCKRCAYQRKLTKAKKYYQENLEKCRETHNQYYQKHRNLRKKKEEKK